MPAVSLPAACPYDPDKRGIAEPNRAKRLWRGQPGGHNSEYGYSEKGYASGPRVKPELSAFSRIFATGSQQVVAFFQESSFSIENASGKSSSPVAIRLS